MEFSENLCKQLGVPFYSKTCDIKTEAQKLLQKEDSKPQTKAKKTAKAKAEEQTETKPKTTRKRTVKKIEDDSQKTEK